MISSRYSHLSLKKKKINKSHTGLPGNLQQQKVPPPHSQQTSGQMRQNRCYLTSYFTSELKTIQEKRRWLWINAYVQVNFCSRKWPQFCKADQRTDKDGALFITTSRCKIPWLYKWVKYRIYLYIKKPIKLLCISGNEKKKTVTCLFLVRESSCVQNVLCFDL